MSPHPIEPIPDIVLSAEVPHTTVRRVPAARVRISRRVVTEVRTVEVEVRREELHVERLPVPDPTGRVEDDPAGTSAGGGPILTWILHEEIPEVVNRVVAVERVQVFIDDIAGTEMLTADLRHEEVALTRQSLPDAARKTPRV